MCENWPFSFVPQNQIPIELDWHLIGGRLLLMSGVAVTEEN